jgi:hypothetical protein
MNRNGMSLSLFLLFVVTLLVLPLAAQSTTPPASSNPQTPAASPAPEQSSPAAAERSDTSTTPEYVQPPTTADTPSREPTPKSISWAGGLIGLAIGFVVGYALRNRRPVYDVRRDRAA